MRILAPFFVGAPDSGTTVDATTQALVITEQGVTLNIPLTTQALVITEQSVTISVGVTVQATSQALVITEYTPDVPFRMSSQALVITEQAATVGLSTNVQAGTDALVITEQNASVALLEIKREYRLFYDNYRTRWQTYDPNTLTVRGRSARAVPRPVGPLEIDWSNSLTKGLSIVYFPQSGQDPYRLMYEKGPYKLGRAAATNQEPDRGRLSSRANNVAGYLQWNVPANHWINGATELTMMVGGLRVIEDSVTIGGGFHFHDSGNNSSRAGVLIQSTDNILFQADNADDQSASVGDGATERNQYYGILTYNGAKAVGDRAYGFAKHQWVSLGSASKATSLLTTYDKLFFNATNYAAVTRGTADWMDYGFVWDRELQWEEVQQLTRNPYAFMRQVLDIPMFAPPTTDLDLQAGSQPLVLSPQNVDVNAENNANATSQSLVLSEQSVNVQVGDNIHPTPQALTITEYKVARDVYAQSQALSITTRQVGQPLTTIKTQALTITAYPALIPLDKNVDATAQALEITPHHVGISPRKVEATSQALSLTGLSTGSMHVSASTAALTITGQAQNVFNRGPDWLRGRTADVLREPRTVDAD